MLAMFPYNDGTKSIGLDLNFVTQNVWSLNISTKNIFTEQKILAITNGGADIIFLSDLRLNSYKQIDACKDLAKKFFLRGYKLFHNSVTSSRGVGILINRKVSENIVIRNIIRDNECNYMLMDVEYNSQKFSWGSVYGANRDEGVSMYTHILKGI